MEKRYNVYFAGQVIEGHPLDQVRDKLAKVFKADQATLDKLFSGKPQLIKRDCDQATALKYKQAIERAGAVPIVKAAEISAPEAKSKPAPAMTAAERIAALAAAPDAEDYKKSSAATPQTKPGMTGPGSRIQLTPPGTEVLRPDERAMPFIRDVKTSHLDVDASGERLSPESPPAPPMPDTQHLSMGEVGDNIPNLLTGETPLSPNIEGLMLSAPGTDFSDCAGPEVESLPLDLSALDLDPAGTELLDAQYRNQDAGEVPATDHISLKE